MRPIHEKILYTKINKFQDKYKLTYRYSINNLLKDLEIKLISYHGQDIRALLSISEDAFSVMDQGKRYIFFNPFQKETRINFTLAHELGHFVLEHHKISNRVILAFGDPGILEVQANIFARNFLMPAEDVLELLEIKSTKELAEKYEVSHQMAKIRIENLDYDLRWLQHTRSKKFNRK